ncbi:DUF4291 domain-containing protein [Chryseobacterium flavum]|uniref:DUF4291 domain-containing protein n=1 Tax=Chryseobacterium flavum TaxID=415851 RepID=UPI0028A87AC8|nr:DUF4291 domain-containing protein [Chryseobacterium flavum]
MKEQIIRAVYDNDTITVYQAFNKDIAESAVSNQTFISPPFKKERMTWIKPSFLWMMYRSGWATKENQENILAIKIKRSGFEWALKNSCLSHFDNNIYKSHEDWKEILNSSPVRIQWDPEKDIFLKSLNYRSIQIGLSGIAVEKYIADWIVSIDNITEYCKQIHQLVKEGKINQATIMLPDEKEYN